MPSRVRAPRSLRLGSPCREAGPEAPTSTPDDQKLDNCVTDCQTCGRPGSPTPPLCKNPTWPPGPDSSDYRGGNPAASVPAPPPSPAAGAHARADLASRRSGGIAASANLGAPPRPLHLRPTPSSPRTLGSGLPAPGTLPRWESPPPNKSLASSPSPARTDSGRDSAPLAPDLPDLPFLQTISSPTLHPLYPCPHSVTPNRPFLPFL